VPISKKKRQPARGQSPNVRINPEDKAVLDQIAQQTNESHPRLLHRAIELLRRQRFFEEMNSAYSEMRSDSKQWRTEMEERELFDAAVDDGLSRP